jgi:hypothetical protein
VVSVDAKKKELLGEFKNGGVEYRPTGEPTRVTTHDFVDPKLGRAVPYEIYDLANDEGWVSVSRKAGRHRPVRRRDDQALVVLDGKAASVPNGTTATTRPA